LLVPDAPVGTGPASPATDTSLKYARGHSQSIRRHPFQPSRRSPRTGTPAPEIPAAAANANASKGDYFSHDNKAYYRRDGKTFLLTGDAMGDVELDADQSAKLDNA